MKKNTKILLSIVLILMILVICSFIYFFNSLNSNKPLNEKIELNTTSQIKPKEETSDDIKIELVDYKTFKQEGIPFNFAILKIRVSANKETNISLKHFTTNEKINLSEVDDYVSKLELKNYFLGKQNVVFDLISYDKQYFANIFVPIIDKTAKTISLSSDLFKEDISIDLTKNLSDLSILKYEAEDVITDGKTYQMKITKAFPITGVNLIQKTGGDEFEYSLPSTVEVYAFILNATSLWGDVIVIEEAEYVSDKNVSFKALDSSINSSKYPNIIGEEINDNGSGNLLFVAYSPIDNPISYKGILKLKVKGNDNWISINVDLN